MSGRAPIWLDPRDPEAPFPPVELALDEPNGLLAVGGDLSPTRLLSAYRAGIFPWYSAGQPILWWSPDPRLVLWTDQLRISRSLRKTLRKGLYSVSMDQAFADVMQACAEPRGDGQGTWITDEMQAAYAVLHRLGHAHSVEVWEGSVLVGGLYGVAAGRIFFGESMFSRRSDTSKIGFAHLVLQLQRWGFPLIDCQVHTGHLASLGAVMIPRSEFIAELQHGTALAPVPGWAFDADLTQTLCERPG